MDTSHKLPHLRSSTNAHRRPAATLAGLIFFTAAHAQLLDDRVASFAVAGIADIRVGNGQTLLNSQFAGGTDVPLAAVLVDDSILVIANDDNGTAPDRGTAQSETFIPFSPASVATLRAGVTLTGNRSSGQGRFPTMPVDGATGRAGATSSDLFTYTGSVPATLSITFELDGIVHDPAGNAYDNDLTYLRSDFAILRADTFVFGFDLATILAETGGQLLFAGGVPARGQLAIEGDTGGLASLASTTLSFDVQPGEVFVIWQSLDASASRGTRSANALSTLQATFGQPAQVQRAYTIPEPAMTTLIAACAVLALAGAARRRRSSAGL